MHASIRMLLSVGGCAQERKLVCAGTGPPEEEEILTAEKEQRDGRTVRPLPVSNQHICHASTGQCCNHKHAVCTSKHAAARLPGIYVALHACEV